VLLDQKLWVKASDIVCAKIVVTGYQSSGKPVLQHTESKIFDGFALVIVPVDKETSDPTCQVMLQQVRFYTLKKKGWR